MASNIVAVEAQAEDRPAALPGPEEAFAAIYPGKSRPLPAGFVASVRALERELGMPVFLLVQGGGAGFESLEAPLVEALQSSRKDLPRDRPLAVLLHSPGGSAKCAYQAATTLRRHCGGFTAIVPRQAKSAATLFALGAGELLLGTCGELGPLDAQFDDSEREVMVSALDEVQALERLHAFGLEAIDRSMALMVKRSGKKIETLLPTMLRYVADMMSPLLEKIDAVHYTQMSRALKVAEEYAIRLLQPKYSREEAQKIARHLVEHYPEHGFVIDAEEAGSFGLQTGTAPPALQEAIDATALHLDGITAIGILRDSDR